MKITNKINLFSRSPRASQRGALRDSRSLLLRKPCPLALITRSRTNLFCLGVFFIVLFLLFIPATQAQVIGNFDFLKGIVPCGTSYSPAPCTVCHFYKLIQNVINFILFTSASLITLMVTYVGLLFLLSGGNPKKIEDAKSKLWLLVWGIFWVLGSWLVLNTVINFISVIGKSKDFPLPWHQISCQVSQSSSGNELPFNPGGGSFGGAGASGGWDEARPAAVKRLDGGVYNDGVDVSTAGYQQINEEIDGLEQVGPAAPYNSTVPISPVVNQEVQQAETGSVVNKNLVKAIVQAESSGNPNATHLDKDGQSSYGLMQVRPDTAKIYDSSLTGLTNEQVGEKLKNPDYNVKIDTAYLQDLAAKYDGDLNKVIAAYNGGPGANGPSRDCPGSLRWQCEWDNQAHTVPNAGYKVTRDYVTNVKQYYSQINK